MPRLLGGTRRNPSPHSIYSGPKRPSAESSVNASQVETGGSLLDCRPFRASSLSRLLTGNFLDHPPLQHRKERLVRSLRPSFRPSASAVPPLLQKRQVHCTLRLGLPSSTHASIGGGFLNQIHLRVTRLSFSIYRHAPNNRLASHQSCVSAMLRPRPRSNESLTRLYQNSVNSGRIRWIGLQRDYSKAEYSAVW